MNPFKIPPMPTHEHILVYVEYLDHSIDGDRRVKHTYEFFVTEPVTEVYPWQEEISAMMNAEGDSECLPIDIEILSWKQFRHVEILP